MKVKMLVDITANLSGKSVTLKTGNIHEVSETDGDNLVRGKYAEKAHWNAKVTVIKKTSKGLTTKSMR